MIAMEDQKSLLSSLLGNNLDRVSIIYHLKRFRAEFEEAAPYVILKYKLQLFVIENLSREFHDDPGQTAYYGTLQKETEDTLKFYNQKKDSRKFQCCLVGCIFKSNKHRFYIRHLQRSHARESNLTCLNGQTCMATFSTLDLLLQHVEDVHRPLASSSQPLVVQPVQLPVPADIPCKCPRTACLGTEFVSTQSLMLHMRNYHASKGESVSCIFDNCEKQFNNASSLKSHFLLKHQRLNLLSLKAAHRMNETFMETEQHPDINEEEAQDVLVVQSDSREEERGSAGEEQIIEEEEEEEDEDVFLMAYCDFLNRLSNFHFVPQSTIKIIAEEYLKNYNKSNESKSDLLRKTLEEIPGISQMDIKTVLEKMKSQDKFLEAQNKLDTDYKKKQFLKDKFTYVPPREIVLNPKAVKDKNVSKAVVHYVPIIETFRNLVQDPSFNEALESNILNTRPDILKDVKDGLYYKSNPFFQQNPSAFTMMIYSDAIELVNPLGAGRTKHKVIQIFFSLCEIPKHLRSRIDRIQLVAVFKEKLIKEFGFQKIYQQLVSDLKVLESGVTVYFPIQREVKCGVLIHPADNLEAHAVGGFSQSFSAKDICRFCHIQYDDLSDNIHDYNSKEHAKWNEEEYDKAAAFVERKKKSENEEEIVMTGIANESDSEYDSDNDVESSDNPDSDEEDESVELFGIKHRCPLNVLEAFHSISAFPPDLLHDLLEGTASQDLLGIIRILSRKGWFSIEEYNTSLKGLKYKSYESSDRPQLVPINKKTKKLNGKAVSIWVHVRNFPLVIRKFVTGEIEEDPVLKLGLKLHEITERVTASEFKDYEIDVLEDIIVNYLDERKNIFDDYPDLMGTPKPKTHFLTHYPRAISLYGPPMSYWTARYESRHRIAKNTANSAKNYRNISLTISTRQQMRLRLGFKKT